MALLTYSGINISALSAAVPAQVIDNLRYTAHFDAESVRDIVEKTGIYRRRFAPEGMTASDLCVAAAERLLADNAIERDSIDAVLFVSQTPDYRMPATAITLQHRLGLPSTALAFDISLGCSGFVYGLSVAFSLAQQPHIRRVLLLDGETRSRVYSAKDRTTAFLFGDAGAAALIEKDSNAGTAWFSLQSDGSRSHLIKIDAGGYRQPSSANTVQERVVDEHGNIRSAEHGYMQGADVFNFVLREVPADIQQVLSAAGKQHSDIDYFVFHQANAFMNNYLARKLKLPAEKVPQSLEDFGNTSSVTIPLTMVSRLASALAQPSTLLLSGFGVGLSWGSAVLPSNGIKVSPLVEVEG